MIKRICTILVALLFIFPGIIVHTYAQSLDHERMESSSKSDVPSLTIGTISSSSGFAVSVPMEALDFSEYDIGAITLKIGFDASKLTFTGITSHQNITGWGVSASAGVLTILNSVSNDPINISDGLLLDLNFVYSAAGIAEITFMPGTEIVTAGFEPVSLVLTNGKVVSAEPPATLSIAEVFAPEGAAVQVPIHSSGFNPATLVGAISIQINFPSEVLSFRGLTPFQGFTNVGVTSVSNKIIINWNSSTGKIIADGTLFELKFNYLEGDATIDFAFAEFINLETNLPIELQLQGGFVNELPDGFNLNGTLKYANAVGSPLSSSTVELWDSDGTNLLETTNTDANGNYLFVGIQPDNYILKASTTKPVGGIDIDDVWDVFYFINTGDPMLTGIHLLAADFNQDGEVDIDDVWDIFNYIAYGTLPPNYVEWVFENHSVTVVDTNVTTDIQGLCSGDANASYSPIP